MSDTEPAESREDAHRRLMAAIGILQSIYLAADSTATAEAVFGVFLCHDEALRHAILLLTGILPHLEPQIA